MHNRDDFSNPRAPYVHDEFEDENLDQDLDSDQEVSE